MRIRGLAALAEELDAEVGEPRPARPEIRSQFGLGNVVQYSSRKPVLELERDRVVPPVDEIESRSLNLECVAIVRVAEEGSGG